MTIRFTPKLIAACALLAGAGGTFGQHSHPPSHNASPYAGQQAREIKSLSPEQTADLLAGKGMELAKAAELNGYPGPMHTLELATQLELSTEQKQASQALMTRHKAEARDLGPQLVEAERALDRAFSSRQIDAARLATHTERLGQLQARLRMSHLETHLQQTALLTPTQISRYAQLRGYTSSVGTPAPVAAPTHKH
ncbi:MAG: periplasmic heavy metal sensor [Pseudomonadota bacterium]|uniref:Spy/CpxP family protein refolding chaperone n=1 Tax=Polaromonas sp. TaxID=1869339 RepID=UPI0017F370B6|nr:periplasmic heavy metal sensor [Polaromonas sp.]MBA3592217.1 periplasmic heavy metal sensor [Polaromonas sp.]MDQ3272507.1 periplasmic heavy metal sensor [Pseudomonadota bacterium]